MSLGGLGIRDRSGLLPGPSTIQRVAQIQAAWARAADAHDHVRIQFAAADIVGVPQKGRLGVAIRRGFVEIPVDETGIVADAGDHVGTFTGTVQCQGHGLLDAGAHDGPMGGEILVEIRQVVRLPAAVARGEHGVIGIRGIDLHVEKPVDVRVADIRCQAVVEDAAASEDGLPGGAAIGAAEDILAFGAVEGTGDHDLGILCIHRYGGVAELPFLARLVRSDVDPGAALDIQLPHAAIHHLHGAGIRAIGDEEISVGGQDRVVRAVLGGLSGNRLPGSAPVVTAVEAGFAHHRDARE